MRRLTILLMLCAGPWGATAQARDEQFVDIRDVPPPPETNGNFRFQPNLFEQAMEAVPRIHRLNELRRRQTSQAAPAVPAPTPALIPAGPGFVSVHEPTAEDVAQGPSIDAQTGAIQLPVTIVTPRPAAPRPAWDPSRGGPAPPPRKSVPPDASRQVKAEKRQLRNQAERIMKLERAEIKGQDVRRQESRHAADEKARLREEEKQAKDRQQVKKAKEEKIHRQRQEKEEKGRRQKEEARLKKQKETQTRQAQEVQDKDKRRRDQAEAKRARAEAEAQRRAEALLTARAKQVAGREARRALDSGQDQLQEEAELPLTLTKQEKRQLRRQVQPAREATQRQEESVERAKLRVSPPDKAQQGSVSGVQEKLDETMADASWRKDLQKTAAVWVEQEETVSARRVEKQTLKTAEVVVTARDRSTPADIEGMEPLDRPVGRMFYRRAFLRKVLNRLARESALELDLPPAAENWSTQEVTVDFGGETVAQALAKLQRQIPGWQYVVGQGRLKIVLDS